MLYDCYGAKLVIFCETINNHIALLMIIGCTAKVLMSCATSKGFATFAIC